jgi:PAS domain S-box-containing protein/diguanylate cyclase (GGDEF)-like protein
LVRVAADEEEAERSLMVDLTDQRVFEAVVDSLETGVYVVDRHRKIVYWNQGAERISGYLRQDVTGRFCRDNILVHSDGHEAVLCQTACPLADCMREGQPREAWVYMRHRAGHRVPVHVRAIPLRDRTGEIVGAAEIFEEQAIAADEAEPDALSECGCLDEATKLPNHELMGSYLREQFDLFAEHGIPFGVIVIQPARLQTFGAAHGQEAMRAMLRVTAQTLKKTLHPRDLLGRWRGDQFLVILPSCSQRLIERVEERLRATIQGSAIQWWGDQLSVAVWIAKAEVTQGDTLDSLLRRLEESLERMMTLPGDKQAAAGGA